MNFDGFTSFPIDNFSSLVEQTDVTNLPVGLSSNPRNIDFHLLGCRTRFGIQSRYGLTLPDQAPVTGLVSLKAGGATDIKVPLAFTGLGNLYAESPVGTNRVKAVTSTQLILPPGTSMDAAAAYKNGYLSFYATLGYPGNPPLVANISTMQEFHTSPESLGPIQVTLTSATVPYPAGTQFKLAGITNAPFTGLNGQTFSVAIVGPQSSGEWAGLLANQFVFYLNGPGTANGPTSEVGATATQVIPPAIPGNAVGPNAVYNIATGNLDPLSMRPVGQPWMASNVYQVGEVVTPLPPVTGNGHSYRCIVGGESGPQTQEPDWPTGELETVQDAGVTWQEYTPSMYQALSGANGDKLSPPAVTYSASGGMFSSGLDVYIGITLVNEQGETNLSYAYKYTDTGSDASFEVTAPTLATLPPWMGSLPPGFIPTGYNVYEADVPTGDPQPATTSYLLVNTGGPLALGTNQAVDNSGSGAAAPATNSAFVTAVGNVCSGLRYCVVMYLNRNGYISGWTEAAATFINTPTNGYQIYMPYIPIGPPNTQARIIAFTAAGQLSADAGYGVSIAGPYFWIGPYTNPTLYPNFSDVPGGVTIAEVVNGVSETSTMINDNTTTSATFNFDDDYLISTLNDVSAYFRKIQIPPASDIQFSPTLGRMFYKVNVLPSGFYVSLNSDPESVYGDTGLTQLAENNGENAITVREFQTVVYGLKERSGHVIQANANDPSTWDVSQLWTGSGPAGPRAVDVCNSFMFYFGRQGGYAFTGTQPEWKTVELPISMEQINWAAQASIWVLIDDETHTIRVGVPYGKEQLVPNVVLKCNYELSLSLEPPTHVTLTGELKAAIKCYKWSIDDIPANLAIRAERPLVNPPGWLDLPTQQSQILYASSNPDGAVSAIIPWVFNDNGAGIPSSYESAPPQQLMKPMQLGGVQANIGGRGQGSIEIIALRNKHPETGANTGGKVIRLKKPWIAGEPYSCGGRGLNERMRMRISNNNQADVWFDILWAAIFAKPISSAREG